MLARRLKWTFTDLDHLIEAKIGTSIATFFAREGETAFRQLETETLKETSAIAKTVIAVGGGALCSDHNLKWALENGTVVYLEVGTPFLVGRLRDEYITRPMLLNENGEPLSDEGITERITTLLSTRIPYYSQAHITVNTDRKALSAISREIQQRFQESNQAKSG